MQAQYNTRPEDSYDNTLISPQHSVFPIDIYGAPSVSHRGSIGGMSNPGLDDDDFAAFQNSLLSGSRVPSLSPSFLSASASATGYANTSNQGLSPHSYSSSSPRSNFSASAMQPTDDFLFSNPFGQDELDRLLYQDPGLMLGSGGNGMAEKAKEEPIFHLPKDWSYQYSQPQAIPQPQQTQPHYVYQQPQSYESGLSTSNPTYNNYDFSNLTSPKSDPNVQTIQPVYNPQAQVPIQSDSDLRKAASVANQARIAATNELQDVRRQQLVQAEQIQALQRAQPQAQIQSMPPSWMNQPAPAQPQQNWGHIVTPSLPAPVAAPQPTAPLPIRKGRPPKSARPGVSSGDSASPPDHPGGKHNKTERRYRQKVQVAQAELRDAVPALRVHYGTSTPEQVATTDFRAADGTVDGLGEVSRPNASAKATILNGARLYIELLQSRVAGMQRQVDELEQYRLAIGGQADLDKWRTEFRAKEALRVADLAPIKDELDEGSESESEDEAPKKRKRAPKKGDSNGVRVFAAFAMSFSLVPSASTLLRHQPVGDISPGHVLSGEATPTQVISRLPLITAEHISAMLTQVLPSAIVPTPGVMVDWTWRLLVAAVLVLVMGPMIRAWTKGDDEVPAGDVVELSKDVVKLGLRIKGEEAEEWVEYAARVLGKVVKPTSLAQYHLVIRLRRTAAAPYALALLALIQTGTQSSSATWQQARDRLSSADPAALHAVLALPLDEAKHSLSLLPVTASPISAIAEQITLVHLNDLYSRLFTSLVNSTTSHMPISVNALLDNLSSNHLKSDLSTFDQEIRDTAQGVSRGTAAHALGLVLIGLWGVFSGPAPSAQASLASALAGEEINGGVGLQSVSAMLELLYPGASQGISPDSLRLTSLPQNALALDRLALVCIGYIRLLYTCGKKVQGASKADMARVVGKATADLRLVISETKFVGLDNVLREEDDEAVPKTDGEVRKFEDAKERLVGVLSVIGRRAAGRAEAGEDSGLDGVLEEL